MYIEQFGEKLLTNNNYSKENDKYLDYILNFEFLNFIFKKFTNVVV